MKTKSSAVLLGLAFVMMFFIGSLNVFAAPDMIDFELEIELKDGTKYDIEYEVKGAVFEAEFQTPGIPTVYGEDAKSKIEPLLEILELTPGMNKRKLKQHILTVFSIDESSVDEFELEVKFSDGKKIKVND